MKEKKEREKGNESCAYLTRAPTASKRKWLNFGLLGFLLITTITWVSLVSTISTCGLISSFPALITLIVAANSNSKKIQLHRKKKKL